LTICKMEHTKTIKHPNTKLSIQRGSKNQTSEYWKHLIIGQIGLRLLYGSAFQKPDKLVQILNLPITT
jgi:hypothetical protein